MGFSNTAFTSDLDRGLVDQAFPRNASWERVQETTWKRGMRALTILLRNCAIWKGKFCILGGTETLPGIPSTVNKDVQADYLYLHIPSYFLLGSDFSLCCLKANFSFTWAQYSILFGNLCYLFHLS